MPALRTAAAAALGVLLVGACASEQSAQQPPASPATATTTGLLPPGVPTEGSRPPTAGLPPPAEPQSAPPPTAPVPGRIVAVGAQPEGIVVDARTRTVAVLTRKPNELVLLDADTAEVTVRTALPGFGRHLQLARPGGPVLVPVESADALVRVALPGGEAQPQIVTGTFPHDASEAADGTVFVANELGGTVTVLRGDEILRVFTDSVQPAGLAPVGTAMGMLDVRKNDLTVYDSERLTVVGTTPAGEGPTHQVADRNGRLIVTDTRGDAVRVFDPLPQPREIAVVAQPGGPYGITYDPTRDRVWVTSSGTNEVVGYDMADATPREVARFATVQNPYTVAVDAASGRLFVTGLTGGVVQIIDATS
ncbi:hypothetical protein AU195_23210 [Mycobacterium sp. IS-1496]|uniref:hypothetical protein n=1 Tax=Mycobacterium sp. IS-1496 TaxID=1772284 RepID=UPI0007417031|nr:hypothetical protein [Mycobacterium sp. IS-1496]KUI39008.1 hypothetical protein AU195_23210 [Mycobacterium sp. IS-1496]